MVKKRGGRVTLKLIPKHKEHVGLKSRISSIFTRDKFERHRRIYRKKEQQELRKLEREINDLMSQGFLVELNTPKWFYINSIFAAFLFVIYISIFATLHFESIEFMNITIVFLFIVLVSYFLISAVYFISEKKKRHSIAPILFFIGLVAIMVYAFNAVDASNLVRYSIMYTIIVVAISTYVLAIRK